MTAVPVLPSPASPARQVGPSPVARVLFKPIEGALTGGCLAEIYIPPQEVVAKGKKAPVALFIHGGAFISGGCSDVNPRQVEFLINRGVVAVSIEYRLAPHGDLQIQSEDCLSAFEWVRDGGLSEALAAAGHRNVDIDVESIVGVGYSSGGYLVNMLGHQASPPLKGILSFYSINDLKVIATTPKEATFLGRTAQETAFANKVWEGGAVTDDKPIHAENPRNPRAVWMQTLLLSSTIFSHLIPADLPPTLETRRQFSPLHLLSASRPYPPIFLAIPEMDQMVPSSQSWVFAARLKELGHEVECARANGAGHAFDFSGGPRNEGGGDWYEDIVRKGLEFLLAKLEL